MAYFYHKGQAMPELPLSAMARYFHWTFIAIRFLKHWGCN